jgi:replicative DNA helicase
MNEPTARSKGIRAIAPRIPPHNLHVEQTVLGAILLGGYACLETVLASPRGSDFFKDAHRDIYRAMNALASRREAVDIITVEEELRHLGFLEAAGGAAALALLMERGCVAANLQEYIRILKSNALRRELIQTGTRLVQAAFDDQSPGPEAPNATDERG